VQADVTRALVERQLEDVKELCQTNGWEVEADLDTLTVEVRMESPEDGEEYVVQFDCEGYDEEPPMWRWYIPRQEKSATMRRISMTEARARVSSRLETEEKTLSSVTNTTVEFTRTMRLLIATGRWATGNPMLGI